MIITESLIEKSVNDRIDKLEMAMVEQLNSGAMIPVDCPLHHKFTENGFYERTIFMPANRDGGYTVVTSKIHKTTHDYEVLFGTVAVRVNDNDWKLIEAPYKGVTEAGTRRVLVILKDTVWRTIHKLEEGETTPEQVEDRIIEKYDHPFIEYKKKKEELVCSE